MNTSSETQNENLIAKSSAPSNHVESHEELEHVHGPNCSHHHHHQQPYMRAVEKIGRNDPCICGSGKKFKKCCLAV